METSPETRCPGHPIPARILAVDDDPDAAALVSSHLSRAGYSVHITTEATEVLSDVERWAPDLVIMNAVLPEISGYDLCVQIRANAEGSVPLVFLTSVLARPQDRIRVFEAGAVDFLAKPILRRELIARVRTHMDLLGARRQLGAKEARQEQRIAVRRKSQAEPLALLDIPTDAVVVLEADGTIRTANRKACHLAGIAPDRIVGRRVWDLLDPTKAARAKRHVEDVTHGKEHVRYREVFLDRTVNADRVLDIVLWPVGERQVAAVARDITEQERAEQALTESEQRFRELAENITEVFWALDVQTEKVTYVSPAYEEVWGRARARLYHRPLAWLRNVHGPDRPAVKRLIRHARKGLACDARLRLDREDGSLRWVWNRVFPIRDADDKLVRLVGLAEDVTDQVRLQEVLVSRQRLRAMAELSAGVSHNLNNMLTGVLGPVQLLERSVDDPDVLLEVREIKAAAERARDLVRRLHQSTHVFGDDVLEPVDVGETVRMALSTTRPWWARVDDGAGSHVVITVDCQETLCVQGSQVGLHDMLAGLIVNAVEAMPDGGRLAIQGCPADQGVRLTVTDSGVGMEEEVRRRAFEPFFTTKAEVGHGLGLAAAHATVTRWGGQVEATSKPGEGTTLTLWLPAWKKEGARRDGQPRPGPGRTS